MFKGWLERLRELTPQEIVAFTLALAGLFLIFLWHLTSLTSGLSPAEAASAHTSRSFSAAISSPVNVPFKLLQLLVQKIWPTHPSLLRLPSAAFAVIFCAAFYKLTRAWFGRAIGLFSTAIFASLPLVVISARQAAPDVLWFAPVLFLFFYTWLVKPSPYRSVIWLLSCGAAAIFLFTPGMAIWLAAAFVVCRRSILKAVSELPPMINSLGLFIVSVGALILGVLCAKHPAAAKAVIPLPAHFGSALDVLKQTAWMVLSLFVKTGHHETIIINRLPLLNILVIALVVFGVYALQAAARLKAILLALTIAFAVVLAGLNNSLALLGIGVPALLVFAAAGLRYLYIEWRSIFPRNPVPKTFALVLIAAVSVTQLYFGLRYSLAAWPQTPATRAAYVLK